MSSSYSSASLNFAGVLATAFAPALVLFFSLVSHRPVLVILLVFSAFLWLCTITVVAAIWSALVPVQSMMWPLLLYAVSLQELCRYFTYAMFERLIQGLRSAGLIATSPTLSASAYVPAAVAAGLGAGLMNSLVMYGDVFGAALRPGTLYTPACTGLSVFAVDALCSCAFLLLNVLLCIIGWMAAYPRGSVPLIASIVLLHLLASGATLLNDLPLGGTAAAENGCVLALPSLFGVLVITMAFTAHVANANACIPLKATSTHAAAPEGHAVG